jgi:hypothetical protein
VFVQHTGTQTYQQAIAQIDSVYARERAKVDFEGDPKAHVILDMATPPEVKDLREKAKLRGLNSDAMCHDIMGCELGEMTSEALYAFGEYLENYQPVSHIVDSVQAPDAEVPEIVSVQDVYGGPQFLSDVRETNPLLNEQPSQPTVEYRNPDGSKSEVDDDICPF